MLRRSGHRQRGSVIIEFAVLVPLLLSAIFTAIIFSYSSFEKLAFERALAQTARYAVHFPGAGKTELQSLYHRILDGGDLQFGPSRSARGSLEVEKCEPGLNSGICTHGSPFGPDIGYRVLQAEFTSKIAEVFHRYTGSAHETTFSRTMLIPLPPEEEAQWESCRGSQESCDCASEHKGPGRPPCLGKRNG